MPTRKKHPTIHWIRFAVLLVTAMILQASFVHAIALADGSVFPNLLLILLIYTSLYCEAGDLIIAAFAIGLAADVVGQTIGPHTVAYGTTGSLLGELRRHLVVERLLHQILAIALMGTCSAGLASLLALVKAPPDVSFSTATLVWGPLYSAVAGPALFLILHTIFGTPRRYRRVILF